MSAISLQLLGPVRLVRGRETVELRRQKARAVLALLVANERPPTRDALMALLWPDATQARAAGSLRTVLSELRKALPQGALEVTPSGLVCPHLPEGTTDLDQLAELEHAFATDTVELSSAEELLVGAGVFCEELATRDAPDFEDWLLVQRQQIAQRVRSARARLWSAQIDRSRIGPALRTATAMCAADPLDETGQRCLIETHLLQGDETAARETYDQFSVLFEREYGQPVSEETRALLSEPVGSSSALRRKPLRSARAVATNLPAQLDSFIGREAELVALVELLASDRLVTVTGSGGAGKTRLALKAAATEADRFPDGVWWLELARLTEAHEVAQALADALGAQVGEGSRASDAVVRRLAGDRALVVFDNCEHLVTPAAELAVHILEQCANVTVLATSRGPLDAPGERVWRAPSLSLPSDSVEAEDSDAVRLFVERTRRVRPGFALTQENQPTVVDICSRLDGVPLAIELAAARTRALTVAQISDGLSDALGLLTRGTRTSLPRHRTLDASIAWSVELLTDTEQAVLRRLSVFTGSFDLAAVQAICGDTLTGSAAPTVVLDAFERLLDLSLVSPVAPVSEDREGRFAMLETVRQFGVRQLEQGGDLKALREHHARYFASLAEIGPKAETADELGVAQRLDPEEANLRTALAWHRDHDRVDELVAMADDLAPYWNSTGATSEGNTWLTCALEALAHEPSVMRARLLAHRALVRSNTGDYRGCLGDCKEAGSIAEHVGDTWAIGRVSWVMADFAVYGDRDAWRPLSERAVEALTASGDRFALAYARVWRAVPHLIRGYCDEGVAALEAAAESVARLDNPTVCASHRAWQGWAALYSGDFERTAALATQQLASPQCRLATQKFFAEWLLAAAACNRGIDHPVLAQFAVRAESARRRGETLAAVMYQLYHSFCLLYADPEAALASAEDLLARYRGSVSYENALFESHVVAAWAALTLGRGDEAWTHVDASHASGSSMSWPINVIPRRLIRSLLLVGGGDLETAAADADAGIAVAQRHGLATFFVHALETRAVVAVAADDAERSARLLGAASTRREEMGMADAFLPMSAPRAQAIERARAVLGDDAFEAARTEGYGQPVSVPQKFVPSS